jgi:uncharacterized protein (TIGR01777 family)
MRIVLAGASGFLGTRLRTSLAAQQHTLIRLVRRPAERDDEHRWDPFTGALDPEVLAGSDAVVNLCGAGIGDKRWTDAYKRELVDSRVRPTSSLATALAALPVERRPRLLLNASAIGFYGDTGDATVDESSPAGGGFFPELAQAWEGATARASEAGVRVVRLRSGLVLDSGGGLLRPFALTTRLYLGGPLAGGRHWMPWISIADWTGAIRFLIEHEEISGPVNVVGPDPVRNKDFARALGRALNRPAPWPVPRLALRIVLGEFVHEALASQRVLPGVLTRAGYTFQHPDLESALRAALSH